MIRRVFAFPALLAGLCASPLGAQQGFSLRVGGMHADYADTISGDAAMLGARLTWGRPRFRGVLEGSLVQFGQGDAAGQAWGDISWIGPSSRTTALGLHVTGVANGAFGGAMNGTATAELFGVQAAGPLVLSLGAGGGAVRTTAQAVRGMVTGTLRARLDLQRLAVTATAAGTASAGTRFTDASLAAEWKNGRATLGGLAGTRAGDLARRPWLQGWASWSFTTAVSLEASAGSFPRDITGLDHGRFVNVGIRFRIPTSAELAQDEQDSAALIARLAAPAAESRAVQVERVDSASARATFTVAGTASLAIVGEWNEWRPDTLVSLGDGRWTGVLPLVPGSYRFALVSADGRWILPAGVTRLPDDFGSEVGILAIP